MMYPSYRLSVRNGRSFHNSSLFCNYLFPGHSTVFGEFLLLSHTWTPVYVLSISPVVDRTYLVRFIRLTPVLGSTFFLCPSGSSLSYLLVVLCFGSDCSWIKKSHHTFVGHYSCMRVSRSRTESSYHGTKTMYYHKYLSVSKPDGRPSLLLGTSCKPQNIIFFFSDTFDNCNFSLPPDPTTSTTSRFLDAGVRNEYHDRSFRHVLFLPPRMIFDLLVLK